MKKLLLLLVLVCTYVFGAIDLNTASKDELMTLKGVGESKAEAIIEYRKANKFNSIEDIKKVKGIGDKIYKDNKNSMSVDKANKDKDKKEEKKDK
ncbi:competence protein ComEA [Campylobacter sputorum subsp. bubulus]|uniref:Competence protein ComEA n=1 Tax=Campylobacter sputorum subsp. sputorum TaxID=32024 RepID=A0A381DLT9_9BACT|nr:helix-hairpin-helix domain-containing protein [Campylobacter sputorum]ASM34843.1 putative ComE family competence protein [Campylobacter sputorum aubsp. sputorum RM3237]ASM35027.1 putative ComE family competence protein [Campylobacter sputorum aubsp. sputorum RM3237]ASM36693.1 putative ComE family competence protein [Campylobacter sputorum bv. faecalis CCUG 20703]KAB0582023.1 helix-hairpin-helix domain-containing protein [Campylobacter sputorum subsp. sputorum]QEL05034.1 competence protein, 